MRGPGEALRRAALVTLAALAPIAAGAQSSSVHQLKPTPSTVAWGYYDATTPPVLRIKSGDTVEIHTLITSSPTRLETAGVAPDQVEKALRDIHSQVTNKGPGGHILTGPIFVEGAEPGDVLEVRILTVKLAIAYAYNSFAPGRGFLPEDFPYARTKIIPLDEKKMLARFADGIEIPLRPFFGSMGIAPPEGSGRISSAPPWIHEDLNEATKMAVREMIDFLATEKRLARDEAYMLTSVAADVNITQLVDGNKGVHAMIPKAIFTNR